MESSVTDRLWDKDVQEFISACRQEKLSDIALDHRAGADGRALLTVSATYRSRKGRIVPVGYRWADSRSGLAAEVYAGKAKAPAGVALDGLFRVALRAGLWAERRHVAFALLAVTDVQSKADGVSSRLQLEYLKVLGGKEPDFAMTSWSGRDDSPEVPDRKTLLARARELTMQTLNDLAYLYGTRTGQDAP
ncbi:hypothetical protein JOE31_002411 [Arthrobacter sp. PvP023]|uniref:hypothetical protein n=1 Tax=Micrococcaceae TaxID=1268 RepID=UPI001AE9695B|nr:hypothetical protein [Arthrobacter sp. PvP023]MBP1136179.1 hypothetical protein [Arthrobacter sp. PvP023]